MKRASFYQRSLVVSLFLLAANTLQALTISTEITGIQKVQSDLKELHLSITTQAKERSEIEDRFQTLQDQVKESGLCRGGTYNIYLQNSKKTQTKLYAGTLRYKCRFIQNTPMQELIDALNTPALKIAQGEIRYVLNEDQKASLFLKMEQHLFDKAQKTIRRYNTITHKNCTLSKYRFNHTRIMPIPMQRSSFDPNRRSGALINPLQNELSFSLQAQIEMECR